MSILRIAIVAAATACLATAASAEERAYAYRLPTVTLPAAPAAAKAPPGLGAAGIRQRVAGSMSDLYPIAGSGLRLSAGTRMFARRNFLAETDASARGALGSCRLSTTGGTTRPGLRRFDPAVTAGYVAPVGPMQIGVEAGALAGPLYASAPGMPRRAAPRADRFRPDAIANLVLGMRF